MYLVCNLFTAKCNRSRCRSRWENLDRGQYRFQPIKFVNSVVLSPCETQPYNNSYLITESEVVTGKSQTEALPYWPSDSEVNTIGRGLRFSRNDRTVEVIKLFIILLMNLRKEQNYSSGSHQFTSGDARVYRFIRHLKPRAKLHSQWMLRIPWKTTGGPDVVSD